MHKQEYVILVDEFDNEIGTMEKLEAHKKAKLHRAFSGFIFNSKKELLIQKRALNKYHNPGIWSNTVCSHPQPNESTLDAVKRRIIEEFGFSSDFTEVGKFIYKKSFSNGLTEYELDHVFIAEYKDQKISPDKDEIHEYKWISKEKLTKEIKQSPQAYSFWMQEILNQKLLDNHF